MMVHTTTEARKRLAHLVDAVRYTRRPFAIGRRNKAEVLVIPFPDTANPLLSDETNMSQYGGGFDFLADEPELYSRKDLKRPYV